MVSSRREGRPGAGLVLASLVIAALFAVPLAYLLVRNLRLGSYLLDTFGSEATLDPLARTLLLAVSVSAAAAVAGTGLAWLTARTDLPARRLWMMLGPLPLVIPSFVGAAALLAGFAPGGLLDEVLGPLGVERLPRPRGFVGALVVLTLFTYPYVYLPVSARFASLPRSLEESARLLGSSPLAVFRRVVLPQSSGAIWAGTLLVFLYTVSDFGAVQLMRYDTLTRRIYATRLLDRRLSLALSLILALLAVAVVAGERTMRRRRLGAQASRAGRALVVPLGRWRIPALVATAALVGNALLGPTAVLAWWAHRGRADIGDLLTPALNTSWVSVVAAAAAVVLVLPVAYLTTRHHTPLGGAANALVVGGFALPGLVVALAIVALVLAAPGGEPLYRNPMPLLVLAYVVHFGAQAMRASQVAVGAVPARLDDAARMLGAGRRRRFATIELPLMLPGLLAGAGLVLLSTMKELPATLILAPIGFDTLATRIWQATEDGFLAEAGLASLALLLVSAVLSWLLVIRRAELLR